MMVIAKPGCQCPREDSRMPPINDHDPVSVPNTAYYRRRLADGSLVSAKMTVTSAGTTVEALNTTVVPKKSGKERS